MADIDVGWQDLSWCERYFLGLLIADGEFRGDDHLRSQWDQQPNAKAMLEDCQAQYMPEALRRYPNNWNLKCEQKPLHGDIVVPDRGWYAVVSKSALRECCEDLAIWNGEIPAAWDCVAMEAVGRLPRRPITSAPGSLEVLLHIQRCWFSNRELHPMLPSCRGVVTAILPNADTTYDGGETPRVCLDRWIAMLEAECSRVSAMWTDWLDRPQSIQVATKLGFTGSTGDGLRKWVQRNPDKAQWNGKHTDASKYRFLSDEPLADSSDELAAN